MHPTQKKLLSIIQEGDLSGMPLLKIGKLIDVNNASLVQHHLQELEKKELILYDKKNKFIKSLVNTSEVYVHNPKNPYLERLLEVVINCSDDYQFEDMCRAIEKDGKEMEYLLSCMQRHYGKSKIK